MSKEVRKVMFASVVAAIYVAITLMLYPISFGIYQLRFSEVMTILPYFFPLAVPGLYIGCLISNLFGPYSFADMIIGSSATLIAALITMRLGKSKRKETLAVKSLACLPPVLINAIFIGAMISYFMVGAGEAESFWSVFAINAIQIGLEQAMILYMLGLPLMIYLPKMGIIQKLKQIYEGNNPKI